jgi:CheY-like chemotaxis protein
MTDKSDEEVDKYIKELETFVTDFPKKEADLKALVDKKDTAAVVNHVKEVQQTLTNIAADFLAGECAKKLETLSNERPENVASYVDFLITSLKALSIDIQMALHEGSEHASYGSAEAPEAADLQAIASSIKKDNEKVVLAVDDDAFCLEQIKRFLREISCKVVAVTSGEKALEALNTCKPVLFVLDIEMPNMDGIMLAKNIRNMGLKAPIVFITGNAEKDSVIKAANAGASDFILKPISHNNVVSRLSKFVN